MIRIISSKDKNKLSSLYPRFIWAVAMHREDGRRKHYITNEIKEAIHLFQTKILSHCKSIVEYKNCNVKNIKRVLQIILTYKNPAKLVSFLKSHNNELLVIKKISEFFDWDKYRDKHFKSNEQKFCSNKYLLQKIIDILGLQVCPYCNRNYISTFKNAQNQLVIPTIDHFFEKSLYPYLAISLYNLIPSCDYCNTKLKNTLDVGKTPILYPYHEGFEDKVRFEVNAIKLNKSDILQIKLVIKSDYKSEKLLSKYDSFINKCINTNEKMAITNIYNSNHKELALEMINRCKLYVNRAYIDSMKKILKNPKNGFTIEHLFFGKCLNPDNDLKEPLSKFKRDIFHQFVIGNKDYVDLPLSNNNR